MILKLFRAYGTAKTIYTKILKPIYEELRKDAYASDDNKEVKRKTKKNVKHQKPKRSNRRQANTEGL